MDDQQTLTNDDYSNVTDNTDNQQSVSDLGTPPANDYQADEVSAQIANEDATTQTATPGPVTSTDASPDLQDIKQQALNDLTPLLKDLDQNPEDQFKTMMMLIQASDNKDLIKEAYQVASNIPDDKARAQALLDIVNEINYFTQHAD